MLPTASLIEDKSSDSSPQEDMSLTEDLPPCPLLPRSTTRNKSQLARKALRLQRDERDNGPQEPQDLANIASRAVE